MYRPIMRDEWGQVYPRRSKKIGSIANGFDGSPLGRAFEVGSRQIEIVVAQDSVKRRREDSKSPVAKAKRAIFARNLEISLMSQLSAIYELMRVERESASFAPSGRSVFEKRERGHTECLPCPGHFMSSR